MGRRPDSLGDLNQCCPVVPTPLYESELYAALVDSNSTRTEPCVAIHPDAEGTTQVNAPEVHGS